MALTYPGADALVASVFAYLKNLYPAMPREYVVSDEPAGDFGIAHCFGLDDQGNAVMSFDSDRVPQWYTVAHEFGHALEYNVNLQRGNTNPFDNGLYDEFWAARGFPGTPMEYQLKAISLSGNTGYGYYPREMFADTFGVVNSLYGFPITNQLGIWLDQDKMRTFYKALGDDMFTDEDRRMLMRVYQHAEAYESLVWLKRLQQWISKMMPWADRTGPDVETGQPFKP